ncbi:MAG TPA: hypothetical protein VIA64_09995 [Burkholderiales bacterium]|jgi:hypothetical protein
MSKETPANRQQMRNRIAHLAARMIAQDGISDYGLAKRKAARQAGAPDSRNLPTNLEIEDALRAYQQLYQADEHPERVQRLRELALETMRMLTSFNPFLTGAVLSGAVGRHADVHLQVYTDNLKALEMFLHNQRIPFRVREQRVWIGDTPALVPDLVIGTADADIHITVLSPVQRRQPLRLSLDGRPLERAPIASVEVLVAGG